MKVGIPLSAIVLVGLLLAGCAIDLGSQDLPEGDPDIRGVVTSYEQGGEPTDEGADLSAADYPSMQVVWTDDPSVGALADYDAAYVRTTETTQFLKKVDGEYVDQGVLEDLAVGSVVEVWFTGPVAESYPVQATAGTVVVIGTYDGELPTPPGLEP